MASHRYIPINLVDSFYRLKLNGLFVGSKYYECNNPRGNNKLEQPRYNTSNSHNGFKCTIYLHCKGNMWKTRNKKSKRPYCAIINLCNQWDLNLAGMWGQSTKSKERMAYSLVLKFHVLSTSPSNLPIILGNQFPLVIFHGIINDNIMSVSRKTQLFHDIHKIPLYY